MRALALETYDRGVNRDPRNLVGRKVALAIASRTNMKGDFTTGMSGMSAFRIANELHAGSINRTIAHLKMAEVWNG